MDINNTKPLAGQSPFPTRELWRALLVIHNHYFVEKLAGYVPVPDVVQPPRKSWKPSGSWIAGLTLRSARGGRKRRTSNWIDHSAWRASDRSPCLFSRGENAPSRLLPKTFSTRHQPGKQTTR